MAALAPQQQGSFLVALGVHMCTHGLAATSVLDMTLPPVGVRVPDAAALTAWARSLGVQRLSAMPITGQGWASVEFATSVAGDAVTVWAPVEGWPPDMVSLTVDDLARFSDTGTDPTREGR